MSHALPYGEPRLRVSALYLVVAILIAVASVTSTAARGLVQAGTAAAFCVLIAAGEIIRIRLPGGRDIAPLSASGSLAYVLVTEVGSRDALHGAAQAVAVVCAGLLLGSLPQVALGRVPPLDYLASRVTSATLVAAVFRLGYLESAGGFSIARRSPNIHVSVLVGAVLLFVVAEAFFTASQRAAAEHTPLTAALRDEGSAMTAVGAATAATAALLALACQVLTLWALPLGCLPLLVAQFALRRLASVRATYQQTIRALSRVTEVAGCTENGHAQRVCQISLAVGRDLGMKEADLLDLEYAALMHDIGQLSLTDPVPGGATLLASREEAQRIAAAGADVIRQTGVLERVASIVAAQAEPHHATADNLPLSSKIIKVANDYDDLVGGSLEPTRRLTALDRLRLGIADEYDPRIVESLSRVIERTTRRGY